MSQIATWGGWPLGALTNFPPQLMNVVAVSAGQNYVLALKSDGTVAAWGGFSFTGFPRLALPPTNVPPDLTNVVAISAGDTHALALKSNGRVVAWGNNIYGQTNVPTGLSNVVAIAAGVVHSLALTSDGRVTAWGAVGLTNVMLPPPTYPLRYPYSKYSSAVTNVPPGLSKVVAIAAGRTHNLALKSDGSIVTWGSLYTNTVPSALSNIIAIACGRGSDYDLVTDDFNLGLRADGSVVSWSAGTRSVPQPQINVMPGVSNAVAIAASSARMALTADGRVVTEGFTPPSSVPSNVIAIATANITYTRYGIWGGPPPLFVAATGDGKPFLTLQPAGQTATKGSTVHLNARAVGVQPMSYQWRFNGVDIPGATNGTLTLANVQTHEVGDYTVRAFNPLGAVTRIVAQLKIPFSADLAAALNATNLVWTTESTNAPWFAEVEETHDGDVAAQSGPISDNQQSTLHATVVGPGTLTFWWKVSSEESYDRLWFSMDYLNWATWISGETDWRQFTYQVPAGSHVLRWAYTKDGSVSAGQDAGWVDEVNFTPASTLPALRISPLAWQTDGTIELTVNGAEHEALQPQDVERCELQVSTNLVDWSPLAGALTFTNGCLHVRDAAAPNTPTRFYRIIGR